MNRIISTLKNTTGLELKITESVVMRSGREVRRGALKVGNANLAVTIIEIPELFNLDQELKDVLSLAEIERVIVLSPYLLEEDMKFLKDHKIGYIDNSGHIYLPLEISLNNWSEFTQQSKDLESKSPSILNEFHIGFLFFRNYGILSQTQAELSEIIHKSKATVNITLKRMEKENLVVRTKQGYQLSSLESYFDRWRFIVAQYKLRTEYGRFKSLLEEEEMKDLLRIYSTENLWAISGSGAETFLDDGYLEGAKDMSIFVEKTSQKSLYKNLKLIPNNTGHIVMYPTNVDLRENGQFAHEILISAELLNSTNPRIKEAGERRLAKYLEKAKRVMNERISN